VTCDYKGSAGSRDSVSAHRLSGAASCQRNGEGEGARIRNLAAAK
jgi:hypothetical protein